MPECTGNEACAAKVHDGTGSLGRQKQQVRHMIRVKRRQLLPAEVRQASLDIVAALQALLTACFPPDSQKSIQVAAYAAIRNELDLSACWPLILGYPGRLHFPAVMQDQLVLGKLPDGLLPQDWLKPGCMGIPEPPGEARSLLLPRLDLILVPGLAFDREGNRIGWGKAYYDGLLARLPGQPLRVGVGYEFQILAQLPSESHDQPLDALLTPSGWFCCAGRPCCQSPAAP